MNGVEPLADAVTGGMVGRAIEPPAGEGVGPDGHTTERNCLNCGTGLVGNYCHGCGQRGHVHRSLGAFAHDLLHGVFHFEGKIWRTLPMLAWRPGELTRRYIEGQRASFVSPIALFLFCVFLMFAVLGMTGALGMPTNVRTGMAESVKEQEQQVAKVEAERAAAVSQGRPTAEIDRRLQASRKELAVTQAVQRGDWAALEQEGEDASATAAKTDAAIPAINEAYLKAKKNPELLIYKLKTNAYKFSWMLIPLSVPFMWLLFPFSRKYRLYDHTVFVTYSLCFMTLLAILAAVMMKVGLASVAGLLWFVPPVHMYRQLKGAYRLTWVSALWRTVVLAVMTAVTSTLFLLILLGLGILD